MDVVSEILEKSKQENEKFKPITVDKHLEVEFDLGTLLAIDKNELDTKALERSRVDYLYNLTRDNTQLLLNKIWELETERVEEAIVVKLPTPKYTLPRSRPVPKPKPLTKWQQFAKEKGIQKKKKSKLSWDEQLQKWVPLYGFKRAVAQKEKEWLLEVPDNANPMEDQFEKVSTVRSERVAKNELQRLRNIARARNVKLPRVGITDVDKSTSSDLSSAVTVAKASTASVGKFQAKLPHEKEARGVAAITPGQVRKRKPPPVSGTVEQKQNLELVERVLSKKPMLDLEKVSTKSMREITNDSDEKSPAHRVKGGKKFTGKKSGAKPKAGRGQRNIRNRNVAGRKRR